MQGCAGGPWRDLKTWICRCCRYHLSQHEGKVSVKFLEARETQKCYLCNTSTIALMAKGWKQEEVVKQVTNHNNSSAESKTEITGVQTSTPIRWVHYVCGEYLPGPQLRLPLFSPQRDINWDMMQWIPQHVDFNGGFEYCDNVPAINKRITCEYCPHAGGSGLRCCAPGCKRAFHPVCRLKANLPLYAHVDPATNQIAVAMHHKTLNQQVLIFCSIHLTSKIEDIKTTASTKVQNNDKEDEDDDEGDSSGSSSDSSSDDDDSSSCTEETKVAVVVPRKSTIIAVIC